jgi:hypothetical protein
MKVKPSKRLAAKYVKANRVSAFQCWKRYLPARSGADKFMALRYREMNVKPSKRLAPKLSKANRVSALQCWKRYLPARSGADKLMALRVRRRNVSRVKGLLINWPNKSGFRLSLLEEISYSEKRCGQTQWAEGS